MGSPAAWRLGVRPTIPHNKEPSYYEMLHRKHTFWLENLKGRDHSENLDVDGRIILEWMLGK
jgi:hypothetical protein